MTTTDTLPDLSEAYRTLRVRVSTLVRGRRRRRVPRRSPRRRPSGGCTTCSRTSSASPPTSSPAGSTASRATRGPTPRSGPAATCRPPRSLAEWDETGPQVEPMIPDFGPVAGQMVGDAVDARARHPRRARPARCARQRRGPRREPLDGRVTWAGSTATPGTACCGSRPTCGARRSATTPPATTLRASAFEVLRAATGRRSAAQIAAFGWDGHAAPRDRRHADLRPARRGLRRLTDSGHVGDRSEPSRPSVPVPHLARRSVDDRPPRLRRCAHERVHRVSEDRSADRPDALVRVRVHAAVPHVPRDGSRRHARPPRRSSTSPARR